MSCIQELPPLSTVLTILNSDGAYFWEDTWRPATQAVKLDFLADLQVLTLGTSAAVEIKPALQFAAVRTDVPSAGSSITAGSAITTAVRTHYVETPSLGSVFWFRRGLSYKLTAGSFAQAEVVLHTAAKGAGRVFPSTQVIFNPLNNKSDINFFPVTPVFPAVGASKVKAAVSVLDNLNANMDWKLFGRAFNDAMNPGSWTELGSQGTWNEPGASQSTDTNTGEVDIATALSLSSYQWAQIALAVRKGSDGDTNSRAIFQVQPALLYA